MNKIEAINTIAFLFLSIMCIIILSMGGLDNSVTRGEFIIGTLLSLDVFLRHTDRYFNK